MESDRDVATVQTPAIELIEELHAVRDSVEELYLLLDNIWRNREQIRDVFEEVVEEKEEIIACCHCDASPPLLAEAIKKGWSDFQYDDGAEWNFLGVCPDCKKEQMEGERRTPDRAEGKKSQTRLF